MKVRHAIGSYVPESTPASNVDARVKVILLLAFIGAVFAAEGWGALLVWCLVLLLCARAARMDAGTILRSLRPVALVLLFVLCANLVSCDGTASVSLVGPVGIDPVGGARGLAAALRIVLLVGSTLVVSASTTSTELADACVRLLSPLGRLGVPVPELGCALSLALRFVPIVAEEFQRIRLSQRARGVDFDSGGLFDRIRAWASVFAPLIIGLFRRADCLADSMEARCYAGSMQKPPKALRRSERAVLAAGLLLMAVVVLVSRMA